MRSSALPGWSARARTRTSSSGASLFPAAARSEAVAGMCWPFAGGLGADDGEVAPVEHDRAGGGRDLDGDGDVAGEALARRVDDERDVVAERLGGAGEAPRGEGRRDDEGAVALGDGVGRAGDVVARQAAGDESREEQACAARAARRQEHARRKRRLRAARASRRRSKQAGIDREACPLRVPSLPQERSRSLGDPPFRSTKAFGLHSRRTSRCGTRPPRTWLNHRRAHRVARSASAARLGAEPGGASSCGARPDCK